ncbi:hypothetical protein [Shewanella sp. NIFS-20-20]|nr:hypothetical protein [Shewanella sp. NIFS-20-20]MBV7317144.1 hypothetical protein [Shewanella sp. NIFS-20-20]
MAELARANGGHGIATHVLLNENIALYQHLGWEITRKDDTKVLMKKAT